MPTKNPGYPQHLLRQAQDAFAVFREKRKGYADLVHRDWPAVIDPRLGTDIAHYETPDLEEAEHQWADILTRNPTRFSFAPGESGARAQEAMKDIVFWASRTWAIENKGRWIDRSIGIDQVRYGVACMRMLHREVEELSEEEQQRRPHPWYYEHVPVMAASWLHRGRRLQFIAVETEIPLIQAQEEYKVKGSKLGEGYDKSKTYVPGKLNGLIVWRGDDEVADDSETAWQDKVKICTIEYQDPTSQCPICPDRHPLWKGCEIIYQEQVKDGQVVHEYTLPYRHAGTYRIIAGRESNDRDPHQRYRPLGFRLYVEAAVMNWALTMLQTLANRDSYDDRVYVSLAKASEGALSHIPDDVWQKMSVPLPDPTKNEIPIVAGEVLKWPTQMQEMLWQIYQDAAQRFERAKPNRFLTGEAFQEAQDSTGTAFSLSQQQASAPLDWPLSQTDAFITEAKEDQLHAIRYWDYENAGTETRFYATLTGEEPLKGMSSKPGQSVYVSASKAEHDFDLILITSSETLQEQMLKQQQALMLYDKGWIDAEQTVEKLGYYDTDQQLRKIRKRQQDAALAPLVNRAQNAIAATIFASIAEIDPGLLMDPSLAQMQQQVPGGGMPGGGMERPPQPSVRLPALGGPEGGNSPLGVPV